MGWFWKILLSFKNSFNKNRDSGNNFGHIDRLAKIVKRRQFVCSFYVRFYCPVNNIAIMSSSLLNWWEREKKNWIDRRMEKRERERKNKTVHRSPPALAQSNLVYRMLWHCKSVDESTRRLEQLGLGVAFYKLLKWYAPCLPSVKMELNVACSSTGKSLWMSCYISPP